MLVTVFSDASYDHRLQLAGWGAWAKSERRRAYDGGRMRGTILNSSEAEVLAAVNAIAMAISRGVIGKGDRIILEADCLRVQYAFASEVRLTSNEKLAMQHWAHQKTMLELSLIYRHVPGHTQGNEPRLWVNNLCDRLARDGLRQARKLGH